MFDNVNYELKHVHRHIDTFVITPLDITTMHTNLYSMAQCSKEGHNVIDTS